MVFPFQVGTLREPHLVVQSWRNTLKPFDLKTLSLASCDVGKVLPSVADVEPNTTFAIGATKAQVSGVWWRNGGATRSMSEG